MAKAAHWTVNDAEARKRGEQTGLDTLVLDSFCLAGEIALALYLGHRKSIDLDLFTPYPFDVLLLKDFLETKYGFRTDFLEKNTLKGSINGVKIDCITHAYERLGNPCMEDGIRLYALEDIVTMKLSAIADNDSRLKDFIDIAFLSTRLSFYSMLKCYEHKFPKSNVIRPILRGRHVHPRLEHIGGGEPSPALQQRFAARGQSAAVSG